MKIVSAAVIAFVLAAPLARADFREFKQLPQDPSISANLKHVADATLKQYPQLASGNLALSMIDITRPSTASRGDWQGDAPFYPASVVKLFYLAETYHQLAQKRITMTPELQRALTDMIHVSSNDATAYIVDVLSDTTGGPELDGRAFAKWLEKRRVANHWFSSLGYDISAMAKPWGDGPYGRELQLLGGPERPNRNRATANSIAALLLWIVRHHAVSPDASEAMLALLARPLDTPRPGENQVKEFIGEAVPAGTKQWSKAGWTSEVRHDAAYLELPNGQKVIVVIFTRGLAADTTLIPFITKQLLAATGEQLTKSAP
jgi:beta-lactamase class A